MTVGFHSPLPPARTGVADYSAALLEAMRRTGPVSANGDGDARLYHIGNNPLHTRIYREALAQPGVVTLHDANLNHFLLGELDERSYIEEFIYNYGAWSEETARELWRERARSAADPRYFRFPMLRRIAERSRAVIVHNPGAAATVRAHAASARVVEIPHLFVAPEPPPVYEVERLRRSQGFEAGAFVFAVFGYLRESKRLSTILRAFARVRAAAPNAALLVAGEFVSRDLERALEPLVRRPGIIRLGHSPEPLFWKLAAATDVCLNLRYPTAGETSGVAIRLMGWGKPTLLSATTENCRFPDDTCVRIETGAAEEETLAESMIWLARFPQHARELGRRAAAHIRRYHAADVVAQQYWSTLREAAGQLPAESSLTNNGVSPGGT